jgi:phage shock protein A
MSTLTTATSAFVTGRRVTSGARATTATRLVRPAPPRGPVRVEAMGFGDRKKKVPKVDESVGGAVGGAVLGGLLLGPFGAIIGGNMGANFGADKKAARMEDEALRKQGISKEMVQMVTEVAQSLANAEDALKTAKESLKFELEDTLSLEAEANELYNMASAAVQSGDDDTARKHLTERRRVEAKMEDAKRRAAEAKGRVQRVEQSVESLASQAKKLESVLKENMANAAELNASEAAAKFQDAMAPSVTELELDDPLERKFRELEGR